jgi:hypothetical protein
MKLPKTKLKKEKQLKNLPVEKEGNEQKEFLVKYQIQHQSHDHLKDDFFPLIFFHKKNQPYLKLCPFM